MPGSELWGADTPISLPEPLDPDRPALVAFGGFAFTAGGIAHDLTEAERDQLATPYFAPAPRSE